MNVYAKTNKMAESYQGEAGIARPLSVYNY